MAPKTFESVSQDMAENAEVHSIMKEKRNALDLVAGYGFRRFYREIELSAGLRFAVALKHHLRSMCI